MRVTKQMIKDNPVEAAAALAKKSATPAVDNLKDQLAAKRAEQKRLRRALADLHPVERVATNRLRQRLSVLDREISVLCTSLLPPATSMPDFDDECFTWRNEQGMPRLAPFLVTSGGRLGKFGFYLSLLGDGTYIFDVLTPGTATSFWRRFQDIKPVLHAKAKPGRDLYASATFNGIIPEHIRDVIEGAESVFEDLYIVAEVTKWTFTSTARATPTVDADPLLVGWHDGLKSMKLIASFDVTPVEQIAVERAFKRRRS